MSDFKQITDVIEQGLQDEKNIAKIKISDYYGNPSYYSVMPQGIFDALEAASLNSEEYAEVNKAEFDKMIEDYNIKTQS